MRERIDNPILPGFYPDPSICRVEEDYYLVTSTFAYFPGVPIFHSRDLVHWEQIGNILDRKSQLDLTEVRHSEGIFAPTLRYNKGTFYMITTNVGHGGNFIVTSENPAGPWSDPYFIKNAEGIDPSLFFDDDGKCYYTGTKDRREGAAYYGDNEIWLQELDLNTMSLVGESYALWHSALKDAVWPEGPHIYKKDGRYYLLIAEGGTGHEHAVTIASSDCLTKPFVGHKCNPILTHRHLGHDYPIVNVGHADLVETQKGEWYMVVLASRPYGGYYRNLGRETFLVPLVWEDGWPVINPGIGLLEDTVIVPDLPSQLAISPSEKEEFDDDSIPYNFMYLRNPNFSNYRLDERKGHLRLKAAPETITELSSPTFVCIRQTGISFEYEASMQFTPISDEDEAGIVILQSNCFNYRMVCTLRENFKVVMLIKCQDGREEVVNQISIEDIHRNQSPIRLRLIADKQELQFAFSYDGYSYHIVKAGVDARILSSDVAGGFVGNTIGIYCSSNGQPSEAYADFDWVSYKNL